MIAYQKNMPITPGQFVDILERSGLAERRPADDAACIAGMVASGNLTITAWKGEILVGIARSVTDFFTAAIFPILPLTGIASGRARQGADCPHPGRSRSTLLDHFAVGPPGRRLLCAHRHAAACAGVGACRETVRAIVNDRFHDLSDHGERTCPASVAACSTTLE